MSTLHRVVVEPVCELLLEHLRDWADNPRKITAQRLDDLKLAISNEPEMLWVKPLWALPDGIVIAGNQRLAAARALGWESIPVAIVHGLTPTQLKTWALLDNSNFGVWDEPTLAEFLSDLLAEGVDSALTGFSTQDLDRILATLAPAKDPDEAPPLPSVSISQLGELYELGAHRLVCGDSTDVAVLERVVAGERVAALVSDFPWGVDYVGKTADQLTIANDSREQLPSFLANAFAALNAVLSPSTPFYLFVPSGPAGTEFLLALREVDWQHRQTLIWVKDSFVLGHSDFHYRHESILYGFTAGAARIGRGTGRGWYGGNDRSSVLFHDRPKQSRQHPTAKPVRLLTDLIRNSTRRGDLVLDPFSGSGSTLLACELLGRRYAGVELDPRYADVIRQRFQEYRSD